VQIFLGLQTPNLRLRQAHVDLASIVCCSEEILLGLQTPNLSLGQAHVDLVSIACCTEENNLDLQMKRLWPNGFVWRTVPYEVQRLKAGLVAFRALEDYHTRRLQ